MSARPNKPGSKPSGRPAGVGRSSNSTLLPMFLALAVLVSAIFVVQIKHKHRTLNTQYTQLKTENDRLELEWAQLQLEEATLAQHGRVDALARSQFDMVDPRDYRIVDVHGAKSSAPPGFTPAPKAAASPGVNPGANPGVKP